MNTPYLKLKSLDIAKVYLKAEVSFENGFETDVPASTNKNVLLLAIH